MTNSSKSTPTHNEIAAQAYQIYMREGCVEGRDMTHWLRAEEELRARSNGNGAEAKLTSDGKGAPADAGTNGHSTKSDTAEAVLPNSVTPTPQVTRATTPGRKGGKRETAIAK